jgi:hypothetical protein
MRQPWSSCGMKPVGGAAELQAGERGQTGVNNQYNRARANQATSELTEPAGQPFEAAIEGREEPCDSLRQQGAVRDGALGLVRQQHHGTERGAQCQRDEARNYR